MKLADYLHLHKIAPRDLQRELGFTGRSTITRWLTGERLPDHRTIHRIHLYTKGQVQLVDFLDREILPKCATKVTLADGRSKVVFPWSNRDAELDASLATLEEETKEEDAPSLALQRALAMLGARVKPGKEGLFILDGRPTDVRGLVMAANRLLSTWNQALIVYPGVGVPLPTGGKR